MIMSQRGTPDPRFEINVLFPSAIVQVTILSTNEVCFDDLVAFQDVIHAVSFSFSILEEKWRKLRANNHE
jgi:hypothetical protein